MTTAERLENYNAFSTEVIEEITDFAERQVDFGSYQEFFDYVRAGEPRIIEMDGYKPVSVLDIRPAEHDPEEAILYHLPMGNPLDPNQIYQIATIAGTNPNKRIIATGNPSGPGYGYGLLDLRQRDRVANFDLRPVIEPVLRYADEQGISRSHQVGYSYGSDKAAEAAVHADHEVENIVALEPVLGGRNLARLGLDFASTAKELDRYVKASELPTFEAARKESVGAVGFNLGLLRLSNFAIARALAKGQFDVRLDNALERQNTARATVIWGSESEMAVDGLCTAVCADLTRTYGEHRVRGIRLLGQKHALANDVHLQAAIVRESLKTA